MRDEAVVIRTSYWQTADKQYATMLLHSFK
jgi:hypothetical protein